MTDLSQLSPQPVWHFFEKICAIPHPSHHLNEISSFIKNWAQSKSLEVITDEIGNILIRKPASKGFENTPTVALQSHLDMVPQKNQETEHNFEQDPIHAYVDGDWVTAKDTTLGADNGIGVAASLAVLDDNNLTHGPLEVLLTLDEETGMYGAFAVKPDWLKSDILLNLDSEEEGEVCVGCAGGIDASIDFKIDRVPVDENAQTYALNFTGLAGGHSGVEIGLGRANAIKLLGRFLAQVKDNIQLLNIEGGTLRNAIPREASAIIAMNQEQYALFNTKLGDFVKTINIEQKSLNEALEAKLAYTEIQGQAFSELDKERIIASLDAAPNGVDKMSQDFAGIVESSLNFGILSTEKDKVALHFLIRSLVDSTKEIIVSQLKSLAYLGGANITLSGAYSGWKPDPESNVLTQFIDCYQKRYSKAPLVQVVHAGLECGLFTKPYPNMDMISFGPTILHPHSPSEKVEIETVRMFYEQLTDLLQHIAKG